MEELIFINNNFSKLLVECKTCESYTPPTFATSNDCEALIVLNCIRNIAKLFEENPNNKSYSITANTLLQIINIKCTEFCNSKSTGFNAYSATYNFTGSTTSKIEKFKASFYAYINNF